MQLKICSTNFSPSATTQNPMKQNSSSRAVPEKLTYTSIFIERKVKRPGRVIELAMS